MAIAKDILRILLAFLLGMVLIAFQTILFLDAILLNPISYYEYANTPAYYDKLKEQIDFGLEEVARYTNIPGEVLTGAVTDLEIKDYTQTAVKEMIAYLRGNSQDYSLKYDTTKLKTNIESYAKDYAAQKNQPYNETLTAEVERISSLSGTRIENYTMIIDPALLKQVGADKKIQQVLSKIRLAELGLIVAALVLVLLLWLTNKNHRMRTLWWSGSALLVSSIVLLIPGIVVAFMNVAGRVGLKDSYVTWVLERTIDSMLTKWNLMQALFLIIGILLMVGYLLYRRKQIIKSTSQSKK
ncbi:hypothetical protein [Acetobacterium sp.]|uniref:hypothetical protein n=1 Tax=Acetobacterium sp. TaxID=1872094 RepID=UPI000CB3C0B9|nr:hypothetical protein [Acetobacterium sp.]MDO9493739.1 hypothetical protein [Acetobacterium sp.]PKM75512.1 MAG: hypothetical protein CVU92_01000 [Firmicutes bacterium HGW-Firmicutes-17]